VFVVKVFMGGDFESFLRRSRATFLDVRVVRPEATVARGSKEVYLVCRGPRRIEESTRAADGSPAGEGVVNEGSCHLRTAVLHAAPPVGKGRARGRNLKPLTRNRGQR